MYLHILKFNKFVFARLLSRKFFHTKKKNYRQPWLNDLIFTSKLDKDARRMMPADLFA